MSLFLLRWLENSQRIGAGDRPHIPDISQGNRRCSEAQTHVILNSRHDTVTVQRRVFFSKSKTRNLLLCNVAMATTPGGGKSHCPLSDLSLGWDNKGQSRRPRAACDSRYGLGTDPYSGETRPVCERKGHAQW